MDELQKKVQNNIKKRNIKDMVSCKADDDAIATGTPNEERWKERCNQFNRLMCQNHCLIQACETLRESNTKLLDELNTERELNARNNEYDSYSTSLYLDGELIQCNDKIDKWYEKLDDIEYSMDDRLNKAFHDIELMKRNISDLKNK